MDLSSILGELPRQTRPDGTWLEDAGLDVTAMARKMLEAGARLSTISALARPDGETDLIYHYSLDRNAVNLRTRTHQQQIASITTVTQAAGWIEREIHDLYSVEFLGHPDLARLVRPVEVPEGFYREQGGAAGKAERDAAAKTAKNKPAGT